MTSGIRIRAVQLAMLLLITAGCCDKATLERCRAEAADRQKLLARPVVTAANGPIRFDVKSASDAAIDVTLVRASCMDGMGAGAEVKVSWDVGRAGLAGVRVRVGSNGNADKVWIESGPKGDGVTGPWIGDGSILRLSDSFDDSVIAEVRVHALACDGNPK